MIGTNHPDHPIPSTGLKNRWTSFLERRGVFWSVLECGCGYNISIPPSWSVVECSGREWQMEWQILLHLGTDHPDHPDYPPPLLVTTHTDHPDYPGD